MTPDQIIREEFEAWHTEARKRIPTRHAENQERYHPHSTQAAWEVWQAAWGVAGGVQGMSAQRKDRAMGTGMDFAEAAGTPDFYAVGRLRARVAELEVEVNLLHRQRHAAQEDAANARLLAEVRQLSQGEIDRLRAELAALRGQAGVVVSELMGVPMLQEEFADNGGHSHWNLFDSGTGELIWTEAQEEEWYKHNRRPLSTLPSPRVLRDGIVEVPAEELAVLRDGFGLLRTAWNLSLCGERIGAQAGALIERYDALRAGEAGKGGAT